MLNFGSSGLKYFVQHWNRLLGMGVYGKLDQI